MKDKKDRLRNLGASTGTAVFAVLLVGVVAFGASTIRDGAMAPAASDTPVAAELTDDGDFKPAPDRDERDEATPKPKPSPDAKVKDKAKDEPKQEKPKADEPKADEPKPQPDPTEKPKEEPKPEPSVLGLEAWTKGSYVKLAWSKYLGDSFEYYKVVRSKDATVTWPLGEKDTLVAAIGDPYSPWFADKPDCDREYHYRVFAVRHGENGYVLLAASNVAGAFVECAEPPAEPKAIGLDAWENPDGAVQLAWGGCAKDGFWAYKVVRSAMNESPTYPLKDGDELIAAIGNPAQTGFTDTDVAPGETWTYRVLALGEGGAVLCVSPARTVTLEPAEDPDEQPAE